MYFNFFFNYIMAKIAIKFWQLWLALFYTVSCYLEYNYILKKRQKTATAREKGFWIKAATYKVATG